VTEKVSRQCKSDDLPFAVQRGIAKTHDTFGHDVDEDSRFILIDNLLPVLVMDSTFETVQRGKFRFLQRAADAEILNWTVQAGALS
jgi:hypothetical protein